MRTSYKHATELVGVPDNASQQAPPIFSKAVRDQVELIDYQQFLLKECLTAAKIQNFGQQMIADKELRRYFL